MRSISVVEILMWKFHTDREVETAMWEENFKIQVIGVPASLCRKTYYYFGYCKITVRTKVIFLKISFFIFAYRKKSFVTVNEPCSFRLSYTTRSVCSSTSLESARTGFSTSHSVQCLQLCAHSALPSHIFTTVQSISRARFVIISHFRRRINGNSLKSSVVPLQVS